MQKIKTFPLRFTQAYLDEIGECAKHKGISKEEFMMLAIDKEVKKIGKELNK